MKFQNFINENKAKTSVVEEFYAVTDGAKFYAVNGSSYDIRLFKDDSVLHDSKKDAQLVLDALPPEDGYTDLKISHAEMEKYWATGEPIGKAGG